MGRLQSVRVVYHIVDQQEIDDDVYVPEAATVKRSEGSPVELSGCVAMGWTYRIMLDWFFVSGDQHPWRSFHVGLV